MKLFDHCLAPNTLGDGTGCDNMTAIIVQFKNLGSATVAAAGAAATRKRTSSSGGEPKDESESKRLRTDPTLKEPTQAPIIDTSS